MESLPLHPATPSALLEAVADAVLGLQRQHFLILGEREQTERFAQLCRLPDGAYVVEACGPTEDGGPADLCSDEQLWLMALGFEHPAGRDVDYPNFRAEIPADDGKAAASLLVGAAAVLGINTKDMIMEQAHFADSGKSAWLVTINVGGGFGGAARHSGMIAWAERAVLERPLVVFAQELPSSDWLEVWTSRGYKAFFGADRGWKVRSAVLVRHDIDAEPQAIPNADYHGSYVASARLSLPAGEVLAVSAHASPNMAEPDRYGWVGERPEPRDGGNDPRYKGRELWDSDLLLATLGDLAKLQPVIAAGDFNEAKEYDLDPTTGKRGTWGQEYFDRAKSLGLTEVFSALWRSERATRGLLQLDRCFANEPAFPLLSATPARLDEDWDSLDPSQLSDHRAVWLSVPEQAWLKNPT